MKATELRVGNLVSYSHKEINLDYTEVSINSLYLIDRGFPYDARFKPIPLTEEWLVKFGFNNYHCGWTGWFYLQDCNLVVRNMEDKFVALWDLRDDEFNHTFLREIDSVHDLQNLYFSLTGEELELK